MSTFSIDMLRRICKLFMFTIITTSNDMERIKIFLYNRLEILPVLVVLGLLALSMIAILAVNIIENG